MGDLQERGLLYAVIGVSAAIAPKLVVFPYAGAGHDLQYICRPMQLRWKIFTPKVAEMANALAHSYLQIHRS
jgi:hypothetical protein